MRRTMKAMAVALALGCSMWAQGEMKAAASQAEAQAQADAAQADAAQAAPARPAPRGKRDPFVSPVRRAGPGGAAPCPSGKRCLAIGQLTVKGVVRAEAGSIAVVESPARRVYFLREAEPVLDGVVVRITGDSVVFRENVVDSQGRSSTRDVVKRIA